MSEWRLFDGDTPHVSTYEFHEHRERAAHLEQPMHRLRLEAAAALIRTAARSLPQPTVSDLGCGDGGLLHLIQHDVIAWGYDFAPANAAGWAERGVVAEALDVFGADRDRVHLGDIAVCTEVLEHIADPHGIVKWLADNTRFLVASSPRNERPGSASPEHAWAWDEQGYHDLLTGGGWTVLQHQLVGPFQVLLARSGT